MDAAQVTALPPPAHDTPLYYANAIDQAPDYAPYGIRSVYRNQAMYGTLFRRARWRRGN